ncbi:hypothetical protein JW948_03200 [bacterium]|nr:hypothetical protein [bacterium]
MVFKKLKNRSKCYQIWMITVIAVAVLLPAKFLLTRQIGTLDYLLIVYVNASIVIDSMIPAGKKEN